MVKVLAQNLWHEHKGRLIVIGMALSILTMLAIGYACNPNNNITAQEPPPPIFYPPSDDGTEVSGQQLANLRVTLSEPVCTLRHNHYECNNFEASYRPAVASSDIDERTETVCMGLVYWTDYNPPMQRGYQLAYLPLHNAALNADWSGIRIRPGETLMAYTDVYSAPSSGDNAETSCNNLNPMADATWAGIDSDWGIPSGTSEELKASRALWSDTIIIKTEHVADPDTFPEDPIPPSHLDLGSVTLTPVTGSKIQVRWEGPIRRANAGSDQSTPETIGGRGIKYVIQWHGLKDYFHNNNQMTIAEAAQDAVVAGGRPVYTINIPGTMHDTINASERYFVRMWAEQTVANADTSKGEVVYRSNISGPAS